MNTWIRRLAVIALLAASLMGPAARAAVGQGTKLYHGAAYYPELWPEADVARDIAEMKKLGINVVRVGEFAWAKMEPDEGRLDFSFFQRVFDQLHAAGIDVVLCTPTATPPIWLSHGHPERAFIDAEGRAMIHGARQHMSYENPEVRAACLRIVAAEAAALGRHPAVIAWQIDNELKCHVAEDFNPSAIANWQRWLEKRYGTIEALNAAWGTEIWSQRYQRFDQVPAPLRTPFLHNASLSTAYRMFNRERTADFVAEQCAEIRRHSSAPITHNTMRWFSVGLESLHAPLDFASFDDYPSSKDWRNLIVDYDLFRGAKPGRAFWVMETSAAHNGWLSNHEPAHPPGFLEVEAVADYALGGEAFCYWLWRQQRTGCELPHSSILSAWGKPTLGYAPVERVEAARRRLEPLLAASQPAPSEAAVTWSDLARAMWQTEPLGANRTHPVDYQKAIGDWHSLLMDAGIPRDIRFEGAPLDGLKLLVTPMMPHVSAAFLAKVEKFVRAGGVWICGPLTGGRTAEHTVPTDAALGALEKLAGIEVVYSFPVNGIDAQAEAAGVSAPLAGWCNALRPAAPETQVVGTLRTDRVEPGLAFATERPLGGGAIVVLGAEPQGDAGKAMLAKLVTHYAGRASLGSRYTATPGTLVAPRVAADGHRLWIAVNLDGAGGEVQLPTAATDALTHAALPAGALKLGRYEWRAVRF